MIQFFVTPEENLEGTFYRNRCLISKVSHMIMLLDYR